MTPHRHRRHRGFSAIELVAAVAVTLIVAALGVSVYETYSVRAQVAAAVAHSAELQKRVEDHFRAHREPPTDRDVVRFSSADTAAFAPFVDSVDVVDGRVDLRFGERAASAIAGRQLSLTPFETVEQQVVWICGNKIASPGLKPLGFASGARQSLQVLTPIETRYLPQNCR